MEGVRQGLIQSVLQENKQRYRSAQSTELLVSILNPVYVKTTQLVKKVGVHLCQELDAKGCRLAWSLAKAFNTSPTGVRRKNRMGAASTRRNSSAGQDQHKPAIVRGRLRCSSQLSCMVKSQSSTAGRQYQLSKIVSHSRLCNLVLA